MTMCRSCETSSTPKPCFVAQAADQVVEIGFAAVIDPLHRLVEHEKVGGAQQRPREQHTLHFTAR